MQIRHFLSTIGSIVAMAACSSNEIGNSKDVAPETVYQQYNIRYNENDDKVELHAQFRFGGRNGTTLVLNGPSGISLDGQAIRVDSSDFGGAFYDTERPVARFAGNHRFVFTDINGKKYENGFVFEPFRLVNPPAKAPRSQPLALYFDGSTLRNGDAIELNAINTDSAFSITHSITGENYTALIPAENLQKQKGSQLSLSITLRRSLPLQQSTAEGGEMQLHYQLRPLKIGLE
jgi:hypothetical protein